MGRGATTPYFFSSAALSRDQLQLIELRKIYRQQDIGFIELLDRLRTGSVDDADIRRLNERVGSGKATAVCLTTTRKAANQINVRKLDSLDGRTATSHAEIEGDFGKDHYPTEKQLSFKVGARIMLVDNDAGGRWVNGSSGELESIAAPS